MRFTIDLHIKPENEIPLAKIQAKARECDEEAGNNPEDEYTLAQAIQAIWHNAPEWLHANVLDGWTMDEAEKDNGELAPIWAEDSEECQVCLTCGRIPCHC